MGKLLTKLAIIFIPLALIVVLTNFIVDPANIFSGEKYVGQIAGILASGNNADNITNYNERLLQKHYLQKHKGQSPDLIVMGSSRVMEISKNIFANTTMYNIGVSHANIHDVVALAGLMEQENIKPKKVLINVDPFLIAQGDKGANEWTTLKEYHNEFIEANCQGYVQESTENEEDNQLKKYYTLLTFDYFKNSLEFLIKGNSKAVVNTGKQSPVKSGRFADGSIAYSYKYQHPDTLITENVAHNMGKISLTPIDDGKLKLLNCLLTYFAKNGVEVSFVMLPVHKAYYNAVNKQQNSIFNMYEAFYTKLANENKLKIWGSFSAEKMGLCNADFYDTYHCSGDAIKKIYNQFNTEK